MGRRTGGAGALGAVLTMKIQTINLEKGLPTVSFAHSQLTQALLSARASGIQVIKLIHGYGSSGRGGAIRGDVRQTLQKKKASGSIKAFVPGEEFSPFYECARLALQVCPQLAKDPDYGRTNHGITLVVL